MVLVVGCKGFKSELLIFCNKLFYINFDLVVFGKKGKCYNFIFEIGFGLIVKVEIVIIKGFFFLIYNRFINRSVL